MSTTQSQFIAIPNLNGDWMNTNTKWIFDISNLILGNDTESASDEPKTQTNEMSSFVLPMSLYLRWPCKGGIILKGYRQRGDSSHENALESFQEASKLTSSWSWSQACLRLNRCESPRLEVQALVVVGIGTGRLALSPRGLAHSNLRGCLKLLRVAAPADMPV